MAVIGSCQVAENMLMELAPQLPPPHPGGTPYPVYRTAGLGPGSPVHPKREVRIGGVQHPQVIDAAMNAR